MYLFACLVWEKSVDKVKYVQVFKERKLHLKIILNSIKMIETKRLFFFKFIARRAESGFLSEIPMEQIK